MVAVNGTLTDIGGSAFPASSKPVLEMVPSKSYRIGARLVSRRPRQMVLLGQNWSGDLDPTDSVKDLYYSPRFRVFDADGNFQWMEVLAVEIRVPSGGGSLGTFPGVEASPSTVIFQDNPAPAGFRGYRIDSLGDVRAVY